MLSSSNQLAYSASRSCRTLVLLYLSAALSLSIFLSARRENGDASLGLNLITPVFAFVHHFLTIFMLHWWRSRPEDFSHNADGRPPLFKEHAMAVRALFAMYVLATTTSLVVLGVYSNQLKEIDCVRDGRSFKCEDPRQMLCVLMQAVIGFFETAVVGLLWREFRLLTATTATEEEEWISEKVVPSSAIEPEFNHHSLSGERRPHFAHEHSLDV